MEKDKVEIRKMVKMLESLGPGVRIETWPGNRAPSRYFEPEAVAKKLVKAGWAVRLRRK